MNPLLTKWHSIGLLLFVCGLSMFSVAQDPVQRKTINAPAPAYPELARKMNLSGSVKIEVTINSDGSVKSTKVIGGNSVLANSAETTVKLWKYEAGKYETTGTVTVNFGTDRN